ncbi:MAG: cytochrome c oxidase subunit 3 [Chloroflexota bacterium]
MADMAVDPHHADAHHDDHHGDHFTPEEALDNAKFATWLYLGSEVMIFTGMIVAYLVFRIYNPEAIALAKEHLSIQLVSANTFLLLASSWAMVMGLRAIQQGSNEGLARWMTVTVVMGTIFVALQVYEYVELAHHGVVLTVPAEEEVAELVAAGTIPAWMEEGIEGLQGSEAFADAEAAKGEPLTLTEEGTIVAQKLGQYGQRFYAPTAFHGAHVIVGVLWGLWIMGKGLRKQFTTERYAAVEVFGLYWHFVDVVWIVLFTFIYLI